MRLKQEEFQFIKQSAVQCFVEKVKVFLFGSRTNDHKRGGDIDMYIETNETDNMLDKKLDMLQMLHKKLGEQKIDVVVNNFTSSQYIYEAAGKEGVLL